MGKQGSQKELASAPRIIKHTLPGNRIFEFDPVMGLVTVSGQTLPLGRKDSYLLRALAENPNKYIDPQGLRKHLDLTLPSALTNSLKRVRNALGEGRETPLEQKAILTRQGGPIMFRVLPENVENQR